MFGELRKAEGEGIVTVAINVKAEGKLERTEPWRYLDQMKARIEP